MKIFDPILDAHIHSRDLVDLVFSPETLDRDTLEILNRHLEDCPSCRAEIEILRQDLRSEQRHTGRIRYAVAALAAGLLLALGLSLSDEPAPEMPERTAATTAATTDEVLVVFADGFEHGDIGRWSGSTMAEDG